GGQQQGGFSPQNQNAPQPASPPQGGFAPQQAAPAQPQQSAPQQQGGFAPKPAPAGGASNPMEPPIDFDDDIPF
ncbi:single-stranded DNA-binding protein, partial [Pseudoalteromonas aurantia]